MKALRSVVWLSCRNSGHVLGVGCNGLYVVQDSPALRQDGLRIGRCVLKALAPLPVLPDAV